MNVTSNFLDRLKKHIGADAVTVKDHSWHHCFSTTITVNGAPLVVKTTAAKTLDDNDVLNLVARDVSKNRDEAVVAGSDVNAAGSETSTRAGKRATRAIVQTPVVVAPQPA